nr:hypothetical protein [Tanacetum cinerariifolium]
MDKMDSHASGCPTVSGLCAWTWHPPSPDYVPGLEHPPSPVYVPMPEYSEYLVSSRDEAPMKDQPLPDEASPTALSPGYVANFDPEEDPEEDHADYPMRSPQIVVRLSQTRLRRARKTVRPQTPIPFLSEAEVARLLDLPTPPPSPVTPLSYPLPHIPSLPLPVSSPPLPLPSPIIDRAPLGYKAAKIRIRALLPSTSRMTDIPEADMPPRKKACLNTPTPRFEIKESLVAGAARQPGPTEIYPSLIEVSCVRYSCPGPQELHILSLRLVWGNLYP